MKPRTKAIIAGVLTPLGFGLLAALVHLVTGLQGREAWILHIGFWLLGIVAGVLIFLMLRSRKAAPAGAAGGDEIRLALGAAERRLMKAPGARARIGNSPLFLVIGSETSAKTSNILNSGLQPELLAGEVHRGGALLPTAVVNVWFANRAVIVEAGGQLIQDREAWSRLLTGVQASRWRAAFGSKTVASRGVVACISCEELLQSGARESVTALAKELRVRLLEAADGLGVRLPVYVLFTKADRLEGFEEYVRHLSPTEADSVLGATLPVFPGDTEAVHAERESRRLETAFREITDRLAVRRIDILPRDQAPEGRLAGYLFPRAFKKASEPAVQFLVELCKPSHLRVSPFLRGFYFTGLRQVSGDSRPADPKPSYGSGRSGSSDATVAFGPASGPAPWRPATGLVPQWVFLRQVFDKLVFKDQAVFGATGRGRGVDLVRRGVFAAAAVVGLVAVVGFSVSFRNNRKLADAASLAIRGVEGVPPSGQAWPSIQELQALDGLRAEVDRLNTLERGRPPLSYRWGLYRGARLQADTRSYYFRQFRRLLWDRTRERLLDYLKLLPAENPGPSAYTAAYEALKAHLVTTSFPDSATAGFLTPVLAHHWGDGSSLDLSVVELATKQFEFYAKELPSGNPYQDAPSDPIVAGARGFLNAFKGADPLYPRVIGRAKRSGQPISFTRTYPGANGVVTNPQDIGAEFSYKGWTAALSELQDVEALFNRERWVLGAYTVEATERARLANELRTRYEADYIRAWLDYLRAGTVVRFSNPVDAARQLERLGDIQSPLLQMLAIASEETNIDSSEVGKTFQPIRAVMPRDSAGRYVVDQINSGYVNALAELGLAMKSLDAAAAGAAKETAKAHALEGAQTIRTEVASIEKRFALAAPNALAVARVLRPLLLQPADFSEALLGQLATKNLNEKGGSFCSPFRAIAAKYPFNPNGTDATIAEVTELLVPEQGVLWTFVETELAGVVQRRPTGFAAAPSADPRPNPAFIQFLGAMARISNAWYGPTSGPRMEFQLRPGTSAEVPSVTVVIGGRSVVFERNSQPLGQFVWEPAKRGARLSATVGGREVTVAAEEGPWAVFRMLRKAEWTDLGEGAFSLRWQIPNSPQQVEARYQPVGAAPVSVQPGARDLRIDCVSQVVQP